VDDLTQEFLIESYEGLDLMERSLTELELRPSDPDLLAGIFRAVHTIKGATGFLGFQRLESLAHSGENLLGRLREGKVKATPGVITLLLRMLDGLRVILNQIKASGKDGTPDPDMDAVLIVELSQLIESTNKDIPLLVSAADFKDAASRVDKIVEPTGIQVASDTTLRVNVELLNSMMNLVGELVLTRNQILQHNSADQGFNILARRLDMVTADLRESVMKARMQPASYIFQKFPRMVRDLCHSCNKQVRLEMYGQDTELDKSLLEAIKDPLVHAVRNAIDHGVGTAAERLAAGKPAEGMVRLRAYQEGSHVVIEVSDDGRGLDPQKILNKALEKGLISSERAGALSGREILNLIFLPGFSTAEKVTSVSGRGVGMDVVRINVEKIGGKAEVESTLGAGTTLRMRIPLTLAIIPALVVRSCGQTFAIPQSVLFELVYVAANDAKKAIEWVDSAPVYRLRDSLLPVIWLGELLELSAEQQIGEHGLFMAVLDADGRRFGLVVDELLDPEEIVVKPLSAVLRQAGLFSGATILGNGSLALILDPSAAAAHSNVSLFRQAGQEGIKKESAAEKPEYLVFDTNRKNERTRRSALPLEIVDRIETVPYDRIEYAGESPVLQYLGGILPLVDEDGLLDELAKKSPEEAAQTLVNILVCHQDDWKVGLVVCEVLDVTRGELLENSGENNVAAPQRTQVARIGDRVATLMNVQRIRATSFGKYAEANGAHTRQDVA
jgi:two-component system chemotaxis sensor kinase CheA